MAPFEALYGRSYRSPLCWLDTRDPMLVGPELVEKAVKKVELIMKGIKGVHDHQKSHADLGIKPL